jgi:acetyl-CoA synthetase
MSALTKSKQVIWDDFLLKNQSKSFDVIAKGCKEIFCEGDVPIVWNPSKYPLKSNLSLWMDAQHMTYPEFYKWSIQNKALFWEGIVQKIPLQMHHHYSTIIKESNNPDETIWLEGAQFNIVESCLQAAPNQTAIYFQSEQSTIIDTLSYKELQQKIITYAAGLRANGFKPKDRIICYIPFSIEAIASYLACIYVGIEPVLVSDSFSAAELKKRIDIIDAKAIITTDYYWYADKQIQLLNKVIDANPKQIILLSTDIKEAYFIRSNTRDILLSDLQLKNKSVDPYYHFSSDTISILFSSGTTKEPKAIPWLATTPLKCAADGLLLQDIHEGDVVSWTSGMGWMMAPWLIFASLLNKASIAIYSGAYSKKDFIEFTIKTNVTVLGTIPSVIKSWRAQNFDRISNWNVRVFSSTGEPSDLEDALYLMYMNGFKAPIIEYCGGTEIGGGYISSAVVLPNALAHFNTPAPGSQFVLLDEHKNCVETSGNGEVFIVPPTIGLSQQLLNKNHFEEYYSHTPTIDGLEIVRKHGDGFHVQTIDGITYYKSIGRTDDSMNLGGIKISSIEIESVINKHPNVIESAAIGIQDNNGGPEKLALFIRPNSDLDISSLQKELQKMIQIELNPLFKIATIRFKETFPRTASNKLMRKELRKEF